MLLKKESPKDDRSGLPESETVTFAGLSVVEWEALGFASKLSSGEYELEFPKSVDLEEWHRYIRVIKNYTTLNVIDSVALSEVNETCWPLVDREACFMRGVFRKEMDGARHVAQKHTRFCIEALPKLLRTSKIRSIYAVNFAEVCREQGEACVPNLGPSLAKVHHMPLGIGMQGPLTAANDWAAAAALAALPFEKRLLRVFVDFHFGKTVNMTTGSNQTQDSWGGSPTFSLTRLQPATQVRSCRFSLTESTSVCADGALLFIICLRSEPCRSRS